MRKVIDIGLLIVGCILIATAGAYALQQRSLEKQLATLAEEIGVSPADSQGLFWYLEREPLPDRLPESPMTIEQTVEWLRELSADRSEVP